MYFLTRCFRVSLSLSLSYAITTNSTTTTTTTNSTIFISSLYYTVYTYIFPYLNSLSLARVFLLFDGLFDVFPLSSVMRARLFLLNYRTRSQW